LANGRFQPASARCQMWEVGEFESNPWVALQLWSQQQGRLKLANGRFQPASARCQMWEVGEFESNPWVALQLWSQQQGRLKLANGWFQPAFTHIATHPHDAAFAHQRSPIASDETMASANHSVA
jgi:hypothetical protein